MKYTIKPYYNMDDNNINTSNIENCDERFIESKSIRVNFTSYIYYNNSIVCTVKNSKFYYIKKKYRCWVIEQILNG
jgi:hypothetical protein